MHIGPRRYLIILPQSLHHVYIINKSNFKSVYGISIHYKTNFQNTPASPLFGSVYDRRMKDVRVLGNVEFSKVKSFTQGIDDTDDM